MNREKMDKVVAVAKIAEQHSARELHTARQSHQKARDQLQQLVQFKQDYETNFGSAVEKGMAANQLQDYKLFMGKLSEAIDKQAGVVEAAEQGLEDVQAQWITKSHRKSALEQLLQNQHRQRLLARDKVEQKEADENSMTRSIMNTER